MHRFWLYSKLKLKRLRRADPWQLLQAGQGGGSANLQGPWTSNVAVRPLKGPGVRLRVVLQRDVVVLVEAVYSVGHQRLTGEIVLQGEAVVFVHVVLNLQIALPSTEEC